MIKMLGGSATERADEFFKVNAWNLVPFIYGSPLRTR